MLRGEGRFLDDLAPVAHSVACSRRPLATRPRADRGGRHSRARAARSHRRAHRGRRRAALTAFPGGRSSQARLSGRQPPTPSATSASRSPSSSPATATSPRTLPSSSTVDYDPLDPVLDPMAATAVHDRSFSYGEVDGGMADADLVVRQTFHVPRFTCTPVECFVVVADWDAVGGPPHRLGQFPGALHPARRRRGSARTEGRQASTPHAAGLGWLVRDQGSRLLVRRPDRPRGAPVSAFPSRGPRTASSISRRAPRRPGVPPRSKPVSLPTVGSSRSATTRSRTSEPTSARPSRPPSTGCTARSPAPTGSRTSRSGTGSCSRTPSPRGSTGVSAVRSSTSGWSARWRSLRDVSGSTPPSWHDGI